MHRGNGSAARGKDKRAGGMEKRREEIGDERRRERNRRVTLLTSITCQFTAAAP